ncbi:MAG: ABC transporter permease [Bacillota bacterium]|nr:ABC transporter permease [Bacillota bacterium]
MLSELGRVLYRDLQGLLKSPFRFVFVVGPVLSFLLFAPALAQAVGSIRVGTVEMNYAAFVVPGLLVLNSMALGLRASFSVWMDKMMRQLEVLFALPIRRATLLASISITGVLDVLMVNSILILISTPVLGDRIRWSLGTIAAVWVVSALSGAAWALLGVSAAAIIERSESYNLFMNLLGTPLMFTSCVYYPLAAIPGWIRPLAYVNPLTYATNLLRGLLSGAHGWLGLDLIVVVVFVALAAASAAFFYPRCLR